MFESNTNTYFVIIGSFFIYSFILLIAKKVRINGEANRFKFENILPCLFFSLGAFFSLFILNPLFDINLRKIFLLVYLVLYIGMLVYSLKGIFYLKKKRKYFEIDYFYSSLVFIVPAIIISFLFFLLFTPKVSLLFLGNIFSFILAAIFFKYSLTQPWIDSEIKVKFSFKTRFQILLYYFTYFIIVFVGSMVMLPYYEGESFSLIILYAFNLYLYCLVFMAGLSLSNYEYQKQRTPQ